MTRIYPRTVRAPPCGFCGRQLTAVARDPQGAGQVGAWLKANRDRHVRACSRKTPAERDRELRRAARRAASRRVGCTLEDFGGTHP